MRTESIEYMLRGKVVQADGTAPDRYIWVRDGEILAIRRSRPPGTEHIHVVETDLEDWIFPGLIDLHAHAKYNVLPIWEAEHFPFANRFEWRDDPQYKRDISEFIGYLTNPTREEIEDSEQAHITTLTTFAELQAISGGSTTLQESLSLDEIQDGLEGVTLVRSTGDPTDLDLPADQEILSITDLFRPDENGEPKRQEETLGEYVEKRDSGRLAGTLAHLAEGRSGFGRAEFDPYTRAEFEAFMADPAFADAAAVRQSPFVIIHGCGIDAHDQRHLDFLLERQISLIWSPVSNLLLYGQTLDIEPLVASGINVAIGTDWSPSGSKHLWDESKFASIFSRMAGAYISDVDIFAMLTQNPARALGIHHLGALTPGARADFFILASPVQTDSALEVFFKADDRHVRVVTIDGVPRYGDRSLMKKFGLPIQGLPMKESLIQPGKAVHLPPELKNDRGRPLKLRRDVAILQRLMKHPPPPLQPTERTLILASADVAYQRRRVELLKSTIDYAVEMHEARVKLPRFLRGSR